MTNYFCDSSALIKRYVAEVGTTRLLEIVRPNAGHQVFVAQITPSEIVSALARRMRESTVSSQKFDKNQRLIKRHMHSHYVIVNLTTPIIYQSMDLLRDHILRAADAIQLASALDIAGVLKAGGFSPLTFVCADKQLLRAAVAVGLTVEEPK